MQIILLSNISHDVLKHNPQELERTMSTRLSQEDILYLKKIVEEYVKLHVLLQNTNLFTDEERKEYNEKLNDETSILTNITFQMVVKDQGWGGTGHAHVRYQINNNKCVKAFTVSRDEKENPKNKYRFVINGYELNKNLDNKKEKETEISIWLYCPPWSGWKAEARSIMCEINYNISTKFAKLNNK